MDVDGRDTSIHARKILIPLPNLVQHPIVNEIAHLPSILSFPDDLLRFLADDTLYLMGLKLLLLRLETRKKGLCVAHRR